MTRVYIDGQLIGTFRLDAGHDDAVMPITTDDRVSHVYALCGRISVRGSDGGVTVREVNGAGTLSDVAGRDFDAVAAGDFTQFFLRDITADRPPAGVSTRAQRGCTPNIS